MAKHSLVWYANRSTPQVVKSGEPGKPKKGYGKQVKRRPATAAEERTIAKGGWVAVDANGNTPSSSRYKPSKYRPKLGAQRKRTNAKLRKKRR